MKKIRKMICIIAITLMACFACTACGKTYQETANQSDTNESICDGYFTVITEWGESTIYRIVYANDTKVKYFVESGSYSFSITPLYNADGTLQVYEE